MKMKLFLLILLASFLSACSQAAATQLASSPIVSSEPATQNQNPTDYTTVSSQGETSIDQSALSTAVNSITPSELSQKEIDGLLYMREEEKLAHDVYQTLSNQWNLPVFLNISKSEQTHTDAVKTLLDRYNLQDSASDQIGVFNNSELQNLYNQLVKEGSQSIAAALKVGAAIEEIDILDLEKYISQTERQDIILLYENLMKGSRNHLRSFVSTLQKQSGEIYQPQYLSMDAYQSIINQPIEKGSQGNSN